MSLYPPGLPDREETKDKEKQSRRRERKDDDGCREIEVERDMEHAT